MHRYMHIYVHVMSVCVQVYTHIISGSEKTGKEIVLFEILLFMPLKHAYANKEWHGSNPGSCPIL